MRNIKNYVIVDRIGILTDTFTVDKDTDICTQSAHGLKNGDMVVLTSSGTLPIGLALATIYWIIEATTNTFKLSAISVANYTTGLGGAGYAAVNITADATDTDTYTMHDIGKNIDVSEFRHAIVAVNGYGSTNIDVGFCGSIGKSPAALDDCPDFSATSSDVNSWGWIDIVSLHNNTSIDGSAASISMGGSATNLLYEINVNGLKWLNVLLSGWSAGSVTVTIRLFND